MCIPNPLHHFHFFYKNKQSRSAPKLPRTKEPSRNIRSPTRSPLLRRGHSASLGTDLFSLGRLLAPPDWPFVPDLGTNQLISMHRDERHTIWKNLEYPCHDTLYIKSNIPLVSFGNPAISRRRVPYKKNKRTQKNDPSFFLNPPPPHQPVVHHPRSTQSKVHGSDDVSSESSLDRRTFFFSFL
jgi:hypothetical protein